MKGSNGNIDKEKATQTIELLGVPYVLHFSSLLFSFTIIIIFFSFLCPNFFSFSSFDIFFQQGAQKKNPQKN